MKRIWGTMEKHNLSLGAGSLGTGISLPLVETKLYTMGIID